LRFSAGFNHRRSCRRAALHSARYLCRYFLTNNDGYFDGLSRGFAARSQFPGTSFRLLRRAWDTSGRESGDSPSEREDTRYSPRFRGHVPRPRSPRPDPLLMEEGRAKPGGVTKRQSPMTNQARMTECQSETTSPDIGVCLRFTRRVLGSNGSGVQVRQGLGHDYPRKQGTAR
jgi:hypothetical protein